MLLRLFGHLRAHGVPVSLGEHLNLLELLRVQSGQDPITDVDSFYALAKLALVKHERHFDAFDRAFASFLEGVVSSHSELHGHIPAEWLRQEFERQFTEEERAALEALNFDELMERLKQRLAEQTERHAGGNKWIGTGGTSPFGHGGFNPMGVRIGGKGGNRSATKVWEQRIYRDYSDTAELDVRNIKLALRMLRRLAREGAAEEFAIDDTIHATARQAGWLDLKFRPERRNRAKVLLLLDVGGSMDSHVYLVERLFSAAKAEFQHLEHYYFHNFLYERVWKDNRRRTESSIDTWQLLHKLNGDWRVVIVGDASMSPYEITAPGGSVEHWNAEPGSDWMQRFTRHFQKLAWINPVGEDRWEYLSSIQMVRELVSNRMYPATLAGLKSGMRALLH
jgi:uncharacterized protein